MGSASRDCQDAGYGRGNEPPSGLGAVRAKRNVRERMRNIRRWSITLVACTGVAVASAAQSAPAPAQIGAPNDPLTESGVDDVVARAMSAFNTPGVAVGIVKDGKVALAKGYGVREEGKVGQVDSDTLFQIGSTTKAFTAAALAILVDEGKLKWDDKVIDYLPDFRMYDPWVTREFTIRDLLTHHSGFGEGAGDLMFYPSSDFTRSEIIHGLRYIKPKSSFRSHYDYDNVLYIVAGQIIPAVTGQSWEDFVQARILSPLDMKGCAPNFARVPSRTDVASPHQIVQGKPSTIPVERLDVIGPAGTINCNVDGMNKWIETQLGEGKTPSGTELFSPARSDEMWSPVTLEPISPPRAALTGSFFQAYGLGWEITNEYRFKRVFHTGGVPGMTTWVAMVPELHLGVVVLTNLDNGYAMEAIGNQIVDAYVGAPKRDWIDTVKAVTDDTQSSADAVTDEVTATLLKPSPPSLPLEAYAGQYSDPWRGGAVVWREGNQLRLKISRTEDLTGALMPYRGDVFVVRWNRRGLNADAYVRFTSKFGGGIENMTLRAISPATDSSFDFQDLDFQKVDSMPGRQADLAK
jgi:CubicO group peptidase (beta-lactamase class C family)